MHLRGHYPEILVDETESVCLVSLGGGGGLDVCVCVCLFYSGKVFNATSVFLCFATACSSMIISSY